MRDTLEVILRAVADFTTREEAEAARANVREDLRPYVSISKFKGLYVTYDDHADPD